MLLLIREQCGHCSNDKWWKEEVICRKPNKIEQFTCFYCGFVWWE
jgi:hypothetical protein